MATKRCSRNTRRAGVDGKGSRTTGAALLVALLSTGVVAAGTTLYTYDPLGRLTRACREATGTPGTCDPAGPRVDYSYDAAGNILARNAVGTSASDRDGDGWPNETDCAPDDPWVYPGAPERNDGIDGDCDGMLDEVSGLGFRTPGNKQKLSWDAQSGAAQYQLGRWNRRDLGGGCQSFSTPDSSLSDAAVPAPGQAFFYLVRATAPYAGSWGGATAGERVITCP